MNKINFKKNCVISPIKVVLFLLIVVCIILAFMEFDKEICIGTFVMNISSTSTLILMLFLLVVSLVFYIYRKDNKETVGKFIKPFCKKKLFYIINAVIWVLCIISLMTHLSYCSSDLESELSFFNISSLLLCLLSIYLTSRVYFEIDKEKTTTLDDYLERLTDIISKSKKDDEVLVIAPTIILGQVNKGDSPVKNSYLEEIARLLDEKGKIYFATLNWSYSINEIRLSDDKGPSSALRDYYAKDSDPNSRIKMPLFDYHFNNWALYLENTDDIIRAMNNDLLLNLKNIQNKGGVFIRLKGDIFGDISKDKSSGFFAVANFTRGLYYMGNFSVLRMLQKFQGTYFENEHIEKQMRHMLRCAVEEYCIDDDKEKLTNIFEE